MAPWPRAPVIPQLVDRKTFRDNRWVRHLSLTSCKFQSLNVFLDSEGILRVGGRLRLQQILNFEQKHPMLIPKKHHFTSLIIKHFPGANFHAGQQLVLSLIHHQFWLPHGKSAVKKELCNCIDCFKLVAKPVSQMISDLPIERINPCRAFEKVDIDFAGPINDPVPSYSQGQQIQILHLPLHMHMY
ncbi:uncharacterized protein TNCV_334721 [Trichonephila clavipes]|nr:uncharacterized protein TNCV_334721 [Trichonephila clavipes]